MTGQTQWISSQPARHPGLMPASRDNADVESARFPAHAPVVWESAGHEEDAPLPSLSAWFGRAEQVVAPYKLLVPVIDSPASFSSILVALQMMERVPGAELHLFNAQLVDRSDRKSGDKLRRFGLQETETIRGLLSRLRIPFKLTIASGFPGESIRAYAEGEGVAEIVMGSKLFNRLGQMFFGSVAFDIAETCRTPITLVRQNDLPRGAARDDVDWLVPCDGTPAALHAVRYLIGHLAAGERRPTIHLLNVQAHEHSPDDGARSRDAQERGLAQCRSAAALLAAAGLPHELHVLAGDPVSRILEASKRFGNAHLVMGTRRRRLFGAHGFGSVADRVVLEIRQPLTIVK